MRAVHSNQNNYRKPLLLNKNWYAYVHNDPVNCVDLWGLEEYDFLIFCAINRTDSLNNILYDFLVHDSFKEIIEAVEAEGKTYKIIDGKEATNKELQEKLAEYNPERAIILTHGDEYGYQYTVDDSILQITNPNPKLTVVDVIGCYASKGKDKIIGSSSSVQIRTYNPGSGTLDYLDDTSILFYQTNEAIDSLIPDSIRNNNMDNSGEPKQKPVLNWFINKLGFGGLEGTSGSSVNPHCREKKND